MVRSSFVSVWLALSLVALVHGAHAQPTPQAQATTPEQSRLVDEGLALREQGRDEEALTLFGRALELGRDARVLAQIAFAEQALGRWVAASQHLQEALAQTAHPWLTDKRELLAAELAKIEANLARVEVKINVDGATITLNGEPVGTSPLSAPLIVEHGTVVIGARADNYFEATRQLTIEPGSMARLELDLTPVPPERSSSGAGGTQTTVHVVERTSSGPTRNPVWLLVAAGGLAMSGASVATWLIADGRVDDLKADCSDRNGCPDAEYDERRSGIEQLDMLTNVLWISGTLIAAGGVAAYFVWTSDDRAADEREPGAPTTAEPDADESAPLVAPAATQISVAPFGLGAITQVRF